MGHLETKWKLVITGFEMTFIFSGIMSLFLVLKLNFLFTQAYIKNFLLLDLVSLMFTRKILTQKGLWR